MSQYSQSESKRILLRPIGKLLKNKCSSRKINNFFQQARSPEPSPSDQMQLSQQTPLLVKKYRLLQQPEQVPQFTLIEDPRQSQFSYRKCILLQKILLILTVFFIFLCMVRTEIQEKDFRSDDLTLESQNNQILGICSLITLALIIVTFMRQVCYHELKIDQKKIYSIRKHNGLIGDISRFLRIKQNRYSFLLQVLVLLIHPTLIFKNIKLSIYETYTKQTIVHDLNDLLTIFTLIRVYVIFRALINITEYSTPRASRLCAYNRIDHNLLYSVKCILQQNPLFSIVTAFFIQVVVLGYGIRLAQGTILRENNYEGFFNFGFNNYINCIWCVFITMATVGYGDYFPKTVAGRFVCVFAAISGIIISSLLIVSLSAYLTMQASQMTSHLTLVRLSHQQKLQKQATQALISTMLLTKQLNNSKKQQNNEIKSLFTELKRRIDTVKYRCRQIKSMVNTNNMMQEMNRLFQILKESLIQLYQNQVELRNNIIKLNQTRNGDGTDLGHKSKVKFQDYP